MHSYHDQLHIHALNDLTTRAKSGILVYVATWIILSYTFNLNAIAHNFFLINSIAISLIFISRVTHYLVHRKNNNQNITLMYNWLVGTVLLAGAHLGLMTAWVVYDPNLLVLRNVMIIIGPSFALGAACTLSISSEIRTLYPILMLIPFIVVLFNLGDPESVTLALLTSICLAYIYSSSKASHNDYWSAITNHLVAEERAEVMERLSTTDPLTQLKNRMFFDAEYTTDWKRCSRMNSPLSILMIDLDKFKDLNDKYGHVFGDECLKKVASVLRNEVARPTDCVARYGGEEFIALLPNTNEHGILKIAERMLYSIANLELESNGHKVNITCSIGGASTIPDFREDKSSLIKQADTALYYAKSNGRNCYYSIDQVLEKEVSRT